MKIPSGAYFIAEARTYLIFCEAIGHKPNNISWTGRHINHHILQRLMSLYKFTIGVDYG